MPAWSAWPHWSRPLAAGLPTLALACPEFDLPSDFFNLMPKEVR